MSLWGRGAEEEKRGHGFGRVNFLEARHYTFPNYIFRYPAPERRAEEERRGHRAFAVDFVHIGSAAGNLNTDITFYLMYF